MSMIGKQRAALRRIVGIAAVAGVVTSLATTAIFVTSAQAENLAHKAKESCSLTHNRDVSDVIGRILQDPQQAGPTPDPDTPSLIKTQCDFDGDSGHVTIISNQFPTSAGAAQALNEAIDNLKGSPDAAGRIPDITPESGLGIAAYWVVSQVEEDSNSPASNGTVREHATYLIQADTRFLSIGTQWSDSDAAALRPALFKLSQAVLARSQTASRD